MLPRTTNYKGLINKTLWAVSWAVSLYGPRQFGWRLLTCNIFLWRFFRCFCWLQCLQYPRLQFFLRCFRWCSLLTMRCLQKCLPCFLCWIFSVFLYQVISVIEQWKVHMVLLLCIYYIFNKMYIITVSKYILHIWMTGCSIILQLQIMLLQTIHIMFMAFS